MKKEKEGMYEETYVNDDVSSQEDRFIIEL